jgi:hypothetical protein
VKSEEMPEGKKDWKEARKREGGRRRKKKEGGRRGEGGEESKNVRGREGERARRERGRREEEEEEEDNLSNEVRSNEGVSPTPNHNRDQRGPFSSFIVPMRNVENEV